MLNVVRDVRDFMRKVLKFDIFPSPRSLDKERKDWAIRALNEEVREFQEATRLKDEVDALIDLIYFALGRLVEMGLSDEAIIECWRLVHEANLRKLRGSVLKRGHSVDAVKPDGWQTPDLSWTEELSNMNSLSVETAKLRVERGKDYGDFREYFPFGKASYIQMIFVKVQRMVSLVKYSEDDELLREKLKDSLLDLVNYCLFFWKAFWEGG